jgi:hypothetical protein
VRRLWKKKRPRLPSLAADNAAEHDSDVAAPRPAIQTAQWYPDPTARFQLRYWDGMAWTAHVWTQGAASTDPQPLPPTLPEPAMWGAPAGSPQRPHRRRRRWLVLVVVVAAGVAIAVAVGAIANRTVLTDRLLSADFRDARGPFTTGATSGYTFDIVDGSYRIQSRIADPGPPAESFANLARTAYAVDMSAEVVSVTRGVAFGVGCFHSPSAGYALLVSTQDGVALVRRDTESGANNRVIATNEQVAVPAANVQLRLSCANHLAGSSVSLKGYLNGQQVISETDAHGLDGFSLGALEFSSDVAGGEVRFGDAEAAVPNSSGATTRRSVGSGHPAVRSDGERRLYGVSRSTPETGNRR